MRVTFKVDAHVIEAESGEWIDPPQELHGWQYTEDRLENYLDNELADQGVIGGEFRALVESGNVWILVDYWMPAAPSNDFIPLLLKETMGQLSDGMGENGFEIFAEGKRVILVPDVSSLNDDWQPSVEQVEDARHVPLPSRIAIAARGGDVAALRQALVEDRARINAKHQGCSPLHLAIGSGHLNAATLLLKNGADPNQPDCMGCTPLSACALANSLSDEDSATLSELLLAYGADLTKSDESGWTARAYAENRGKTKMMSVLDS